MSKWALKKPTEREAFGCKALGNANCEDVDVVDKSETGWAGTPLKKQEFEI